MRNIACKAIPSIKRRRKALNFEYTKNAIWLVHYKGAASNINLSSLILFVS